LHLVLPGGARPPVRTRTERIGSHTMISVRAVSDGVYGRAVRRTVDVLAATTLLIAFAPLFALVRAARAMEARAARALRAGAARTLGAPLPALEVPFHGRWRRGAAPAVTGPLSDLRPLRTSSCRRTSIHASRPWADSSVARVSMSCRSS
jgi:hypothetical protein